MDVLKVLELCHRIGIFISFLTLLSLFQRFVLALQRKCGNLRLPTSKPDAERKQVDESRAVRRREKSPTEGRGGGEGGGRVYGRLPKHRICDLMILCLRISTIIRVVTSGEGVVEGLYLQSLQMVILSGKYRQLVGEKVQEN